VLEGGELGEGRKKREDECVGQSEEEEDKYALGRICLILGGRKGLESFIEND